MAPTEVAASGELAAILATLGYTLEEEQLHVGGERALMSPHKLVLLARDSDGRRVVVKASNTASGKKEIAHDKEVRDMLRRLSFAQDELLEARECWYGERGGYTFLVTEYIEQDRIFVDRPVEEQFFIALRAFEAQEGFHMTTYEHAKEVRHAFETYTADTYLEKFREYQKRITENIEDAELQKLLEHAERFLSENRTTLMRYNNHLTHNDFVPHNMRVRGRDVYVLDQTSFWFGNKYEGWARFVNYMELHNPELAQLMVAFLTKNRADEVLDFTLMRVYKLVMLLEYYARVLPQTTGDLRLLTEARIELWQTVLRSVLDGKPVPSEVISGYIEKRDRLRSDDEKRRQREFAVA